MEHTPGPWKFEKHPPESKYLGNIVGFYTPTTIRTITCQLRYGDPKEQEANANLMAAAPEMFDALKAITDCWGVGWESHDALPISWSYAW